MILTGPTIRSWNPLSKASCLRHPAYCSFCEKEPRPATHTVIQNNMKIWVAGEHDYSHISWSMNTSHTGWFTFITLRGQVVVRTAPSLTAARRKIRWGSSHLDLFGTTGQAARFTSCVLGTLPLCNIGTRCGLGNWQGIVNICRLIVLWQRDIGTSGKAWMGFELIMRQPEKSTYYDMVVSRNAGIKVVMFKYSIYLRMNPATNCGAQSAWIINIRFKGPPVHSCNISTAS